MRRACKGHASARNFEPLKMLPNCETSSMAQETLPAWHRRPSSISLGAFCKRTQPRRGLQPLQSCPRNGAQGAIRRVPRVTLLGHPHSSEHIRMLLTAMCPLLAKPATWSVTPLKRKLIGMPFKPPCLKLTFGLIYNLTHVVKVFRWKRMVLKSKGARALDFTIDRGAHCKGPWLGRWR